MNQAMTKGKYSDSDKTELIGKFSRRKLKKFQKTHHIDCKCKLCGIAKTKNDPHLRGLSEDGFKVYLDGYKDGSV